MPCTTVLIVNGKAEPMALTPKATKILCEDRKLDPEVLSLLGIESVDRRDGCEWIMIPVFIGNEIVNRKFRTISGPKKFSQEPDGKKCFWNINALMDATIKAEPIVITEGELDTVAALQSGWHRTVSVPDGAPAQEIGGNETAKYTYIEDAAKLFKEEREIIIASDGDGPGINLLNDLALRLGVSRCKWVKYPYRRDRTKRCKDLNEVLIEWGEAGVGEALRRAEWKKTDGVYIMSDLPPVVEKKTFPCGILGLQDRIRFRTGDFCVITGVPSHGKTSFVNDIACRMAQNPGWRVAFASFEQQPQTDHKRALRSWFLRGDPRTAPADELAKADAWIDKFFRFMVPSEEELPNLEWVLEKMTMAVVQHDCKMLIVDPWNELDHTRPPDMTLTEYTGFAIKQFKRLARMLDVFLVVCAHPAKMKREDGKYLPPTLYDISDSAHWANKADIGLTLFRPDTTQNETELHITKVRYQPVLGMPGKAKLTYNAEMRRYECMDTE